MSRQTVGTTSKCRKYEGILLIEEITENEVFAINFEISTNTLFGQALRATNLMVDGNILLVEFVGMKELPVFEFGRFRNKKINLEKATCRYSRPAYAGWNLAVANVQVL